MTYDLSKICYFLQQDTDIVSKTPYGNNLEYGHYFDTDDGRLYYESYGQGEPICVLHGGGVGSPYELGLIIDELGQNFHVLVISASGHGRSAIGHKPISLEQKADDIAAILSFNGIERCKVLGFSDGAYTAYTLAKLKPYLIERLVAIGAGTLKAGYFPDQISLEDLAKIDPRYIKQMEYLAPEPHRIQEFLNDYMHFWHTTNIGEELFSQIKCPVLLISGDEDDHAPIRTVLEAHQMLANSRLCIIPKAWHTCFLDNFDLTMLAIRQFFIADLEQTLGSKKLDCNN